MKNFSKFILSLLMIFITFYTLQAQNDLQLAISYYNQKQYEKAAPIFLRLYNQRHTKYYFDYYLRSLVNLKEYDKAERAIKRQIKRNPQQKSFLVDLAHIYELEGRRSEAEQLYKSVLNNPPHDRSQIVQVGNTLISYKKFDLAERFYLKVQKTTGQKFYNELYVVYTLTRNSEKLINLLLDWLEENPYNLTLIKARLQANINNDVNSEFTSLLEKKIQEKIDKTHDLSFYKLLVWLYLEEKKLTKALDVAMSLDRRLRGFGKEVFDVGQIAYDYDSLALAREAFEYIISKGPQYPFYPQAREQLLRIYYKQIQTGQIYEPGQIRDIENKYIQAINDLSPSGRTINLITELAHLEAFYLHNPGKALSYLDDALDFNNLNAQMKAQLLLEKAKVLLSMNRPWDAIILFNKIFYDYPQLAEAFEARLMMGKTFMYLGDMEGAKMYLDKIKGYVSTPEANDAIINAFFIAQASTDTVKMHILKVFARAEFYKFRGMTDSASIY